MKKLLLALLCLPLINLAQNTENFSYTGSMETFTVPGGVTSVTIEAFGAEGGSSDS